MAEGEEFNPSEPYTLRLRRILEEYPDGSQVLREILQNSDDAKSTEQIFILDHNTYPSKKLFDRKLDRHQGPALLAKNDKNFDDRDFKSLRSLADSEKQNQFDKIGVMGVGFNSIYHITDSPSLITGDSYVILDPHKWCYNGGRKFKFIKDKLAEKCPDQFAPFKIPWNIPGDKPTEKTPFKEPFEGTFFRYPLRNTTGSEISDKIYNPEEILDMFHKFYENESINCLLFLRYIERIYFYELKKGATEPELLYTIQLENADHHVRRQRCLIAEKIVPMMESLKSKELSDNDQLETSYIASFSQRHKNDAKEISKWLILNHLDDLLEAEAYFQKKFSKSIGDHKFIPNVGLAVPLDNLNATGRLLCFLPLPIDMPFLVSVHGYFAVSTNRRSLWSVADNEDLAADALARMKVTWNQYLFEKVLPKTWVKFLRGLPLKIPNIQSGDLYKFWPVVKEGTSGGISHFCKDLLQNVVENLDVKDRVFKGPSSSIGVVSEVSADSYDAASFRESEFHWLSLFNGYLEDEKSFDIDLSITIGNIGFPLISVHHNFTRILKTSRHKDSLKYFSPAIIRTYLNRNSDRWQEDAIKRKEVLRLFEYILKDKEFDELEGFKMIPLADGTLGTLTKSKNSCVYIGSDDNVTNNTNDECNIFTDQLKIFIDRSIDNYGLYRCLYENARAGWNLNIKILDKLAVANMIRFSLNRTKNTKDSEEIEMLNHREWVYQLWDYLRFRNWDLVEFEEIHLIPTSRSTLRKLKTPKKIFSSNNNSINTLISTFEKFGAVFVDNEFDIKVSNWDRIFPYIIKPDEVISVLNSFRADSSYPENLNHTLQNHEASALVEHLSNYLRLTDKSHLGSKLIKVIKYLPIFTVVDHTSPISLLPENKTWHLLPQDEENSYGKIIYPNDKGGFLSTYSQDICYLLKDIVKVHRLEACDYWRKYVIPYLESQPPNVMDIVVDKLFDRLPSLLHQDEKLKGVVGGIHFVPAGTFEMSQQQQIPNSVDLVKPNDLFDPEEKTVVDLFFEEERVFPAGKYGISQTSSPNKFLSNLKSLGIKPKLSPDDIISRIDNIAQKQISNDHDLIHDKASKLLKYIDDQWDHLTNNHTLLESILEKEWIPAVDASGNKIFSKPQSCYIQKDKDLVSLVAPVVVTEVKNKKFLSQLRWNGYPEVEKILKQLELCYKKLPENLEKICYKIYNYMNEAYKGTDENSKKEFDYIKKCLSNKPWILCRMKFYLIDKVVFSLPDRFQNNNSLVVELPIDYKRKFENFFKAMGVRDRIGVKDLISIINNVNSKNKVLSTNEINNVIQILEQIAEIQKDNPESLDGLLVPSTENKLVNLHEIQFDDIGDRLSNEEKSNYKITHCNIKLETAGRLEIQTLSGKICAGDLDYEQNEKLTTRIKNILKDYTINSIFKEFLQNADDAGATCFSVTIDERQHNSSKKSFLSKEMEDWQGPAVWIYNDVEFSEKDFQALIKLGTGGKFHDDKKIGKFGIGFNCTFHLTDLPSLVSGKYIVFLDPNAKYLPAQGCQKRRGTRYNFIEREFKKIFPDQCNPYEAFGCDFSKEFKGTLFRLPLRTRKLAEQSEISNQVLGIREMLILFNGVQSNKEMLFLRNIESCSLNHMKHQHQDQIWQVQINILDSHRNIRKSVTDKAQVYQMGIEITIDSTKVSETWLLCTGGHDKIKPKLKEFSVKERLKPRGGVASLLKSDTKSSDELSAESCPDLKLKGEIFSYLSLSITTNLGVHLNGNFSLSSARNSIFQPENNFLQADCDNSKWNRYILYEVLPDLHVKLFEHIVNRHVNKEENFLPYIENNLWPVTKNLTSGLYKDYSLNIIKKLGRDNHRIFWTEVNGGQFISLKDAKIFEVEKDEIIANILVSLGVSAVKLDKDKIDQLSKIAESRNVSNFPYAPISGKLICKELQMKRFSIPTFENHDSLFKVLDFILQDKDSFKDLTGLPLVPLSDGSVGKFCEKVYYIGSQEQLELLPKAGPSRFVSINLREKLLKIFNDDFSESTKIKKFDSSTILNLLKDELPIVDEFEWVPNGNTVPNRNWLEKIWSILKTTENEDFYKLSMYPLLPIIKPSDVLVRPDTMNPLLYDNGYTLIPLLVKLKVRFTNMIFLNSHENLKDCVLQCSPVNIIYSLKRTCSSLYLTMDQLFQDSNLSPSDYEEFRTFIKGKLNILIEHGRKQEYFMNILRSLPIWPLHSFEDNFINATSGYLLPYKLPFFSFDINTNFYKCDHELDFITLTVLGATSISELDYVKNNIIPRLKKFSTPSQEYIKFLQRILSSGNQEIENQLKSLKAIPEKSLTALVKADALFDINEPLFRDIFIDTNKILPSELQNDSDCLKALRRIGLKYQMNCKTYIECAREIESQIKEERISIDIVKNRAIYLIRYLYKHVVNLNFSSEQWNKILRIKFVPSENKLQNKKKKETEFESFGLLCSHKYRKICWTQCPLFDENVEPTPVFNKYHPEIGIPSTETIIEHWFDIIENREILVESNEELESVMTEIYKIMNIIAQDEDCKMLIELKIKNSNKKLFLNGENWVAGKELVIGIEEDIKVGMYKVNKFLMPYEDLLLCAGADKINNYDHMKKLKKPAPTNQKDKLFKSLLEFCENEYHDVDFIVGKEKIGANRYVLSTVSKHFEERFRGSDKLIKIEIKVPKDIQPETIKVFLRWLYGEEGVILKPENFDKTEDYITFLVDLLKVTDQYGRKDGETSKNEAESLINEVENTIIRGRYITIHNVHKILECLEGFGVPPLQLKKCCKSYIQSNSEIFKRMQ